MSNHHTFKSSQHQEFIKQERITRCAIHAAAFVRFRGGDRVSQDIAAIYAKHLIETNISAASAIYRGYMAGMNSIKRGNNAETKTQLAR